MQAIIRAALNRTRTTLLLLAFLMISGSAAYQAIPKEANPDVAIPMIYISLILEGVSPEDGERLLVRPMEQELHAIEGIKKMTSQASEGHASIILEFDAGFDPRQALADVREKVDIARSSLPDEAEEPRVMEVNVSLFPVLSVGLSGPLSFAELMSVATRLQEAIEGIPDVLEVEIAGEREDLLEIVVDPVVLDSYGIDFDTLFNLVSNNNRLVTAGSLDNGAGRLTLKVPGVIEDLEDILAMPVKVDGDRVVTFGDVAIVQRTYKDPTGYARINGQPALVLEISKRAGANIIATVESVKQLLTEAEPLMPDVLETRIIMDQSTTVVQLLDELLNNVVTAVALVLIVILAAMGPRAALMIGVTIPGAFLVGILLIWAAGYTLNIVVLFALILVSGMLVDGAIVVGEQAEHNLAGGLPPYDAWAGAASRMAWPVITSTATTLAVFMPLLFWPGVVGEFMKYLPATVILCLLASLAMALLFLPTLGNLFSRRYSPKVGNGNVTTAGGRLYRRTLTHLLHHPGKTLAGALLLMALIYAGYARFNHGVEFFPAVEPDNAQVIIHARGDLSVAEKDAVVQRVESRIAGMSEVEALYARSFAIATTQSELAADVIGQITFQMIAWDQRRPAREILADMAERTADIPGIQLEFREQEQGPTSGKPIQIELSAVDPEKIDQAVEQLRSAMQRLGGFRDISDDRSLPGVEWRIEVDREAAARFGADVTTIGSAVQLVTHGLLLSTYRPQDATDEVDIRVRLPAQSRSLDQLERLTLHTDRGQVPISHFVRLEPAPKVGIVQRVDGRRALTVEADVAPGRQVNERLEALAPILAELPEGVHFGFAGEQEDQLETSRFLSVAFGAAIFLMAIIMVTQFNSIYQALLVLSAVVFSTAGVLLGLLLNAQPFGIVMVGMGIIALGGIVVNNNIVLIDTYNQLRGEGMAPFDASLEAGGRRLRPVLLTAITTILGLLPMVLGVNVDLLAPSLGWGAPSTQWWTQLSSAIAGGLGFATGLTLMLTPCMLLLGARMGERLLRHTGRSRGTV